MLHHHRAVPQRSAADGWLSSLVTPESFKEAVLFGHLQALETQTSAQEIKQQSILRINFTEILSPSDLDDLDSLCADNIATSNS
jgi:hypothetical protein